MPRPVRDAAAMDANRRLKAIQSTFNGSKWQPLLVLPDDAKITLSRLSDQTTRIAIENKHTLDFRQLPRQISLVLSATGTPFESDNSTPKYDVLELSAPEAGIISVPDFWAAIYALWTLLHTQEHIPVSFSPSITNHADLAEYLLYSGLGRTSLRTTDKNDVLFLIRASFWQGAGAGAQWGNSRGWLRGSYAAQTSAFPSTQSFTRTPLVISAHPLRPPKPRPGECFYKRYCVPTGKMFALLSFDLGDAAHVETWHRWMNDEVVNKGWGERGTMEKHREYLTGVVADPNVMPFMMSWDGDLMGYVELTWIKGNHLATFVPDGARDYDRGIHVLVGEGRYRGGEYSQAWFRSVTQYIFLADPRTERIIGEPKAANQAIIKMSIDCGMHIQTVFDFPYKRSAMTMNLRERFFKADMLT